MIATAPKFLSETVFEKADVKGVAVVTGGAGAGLIIAGQLIATGWCAIR